MDQTCCEHITCLRRDGTTMSDANFRGFWWTRCVACKERRIYSPRMFECTACHVYVHQQCWAFAGTCVVRSAEANAAALSTVDRVCQTASSEVITSDVGTQTTTALEERIDSMAEETEWWTASGSSVSETKSDPEDFAAPDPGERERDPDDALETKRFWSLCSTVCSTVKRLVKVRGTTAKRRTEAAPAVRQPAGVDSGDQDVIKTINMDEIAQRLKSSQNKSMVKLKKFPFINVYMLRCHYAEFLKKIADEEGYTLTYNQIVEGTPDNQFRVRLDVDPCMSTTFGEGLALHLARENAARDCLLFFRVLLNS